MNQFKQVWKSKLLVSPKKIWISSIIGGFTYALWAFVYPLIITNPNDSFTQRLLIQSPVLLLLSLQNKFKFKQRTVERIAIVWGSVLMIHHIYLTYDNGSHPIYIAGSLLALSSVLFLVSSFTSFAWISTISFAGVCAVSLINFIPEDVYWILATATTILFGGVMLFYRLKLMLELVESKELIEIQKMKNIESSKMAALGQMAAGVAHEINSPLQIIQSHASSIQKLSIAENEQTKKSKASAEKIITTVGRISKIIVGLKMISSGEKNSTLEDVNVGEFMDSIIEICKSRFQSHGISLSINDYNRRATVKLQTTQISQVIINLLNNAFDEVNEKQDAWVKINAAFKDDNFIISITNSGEKIGTEIEKNMFTPFFTTKGEKKGMGLGLSISRGIIESYQGKIFVDPISPNTTFVIMLPLLDAPEQELVAV